jgi:EAL domain-containing protein (putative c-di-GMP-specific phosphodiesterase class I)
VIKQACLQNMLWREMGRPIVPLSINLSARQFHQPGLVEMIRRTLEETGQQPELLELEITETTLMRQSPQTSQTLEELGGMGISLSIDDFGTGYSSLSYLKRLPVHKLKIDRSFIQDINDNSDDLAIVSAVIALARTLQLEVVAEGVESKAHLDLLSRLGCELALGYHISLPRPPGGVARFFDLETAG